MRCVGRNDAGVWRGTSDLMVLINSADVLVLIVEESDTGVRVLSPADRDFLTRASLCKSALKLTCKLPSSTKVIQ